MIFGRTSAGRCWLNDNETRTGIIIGYSKGAGSKLGGMENEKRIRGLTHCLEEAQSDIRKG